MEKTSILKLVKSIGIDTSKYQFQVYGADSQGRKLFNKNIYRDEFLNFMGKLPRCLIGLEACSGSHYWARQLLEMGFRVKVMPAKQVKAFVLNQKNDAVDAQACCEAALRENIRAVAVKSIEQQSLAIIHNARESLICERTRLVNQLHAHLLEFGIVLPRGVLRLASRVHELFTKQPDAVPAIIKNRIMFMLAELERQSQAVDNLELQMRLFHQEDPNFERLQEIPGIGTITASAILMTMGNPDRFRNGRCFAAYLGLVPSQHSSGGKTILGRITKSGNSYTRKLLVQGAISVIRHINLQRNREKFLRIKSLLSKHGVKGTAVIIANKNARTAWALLAKKSAYELNHISVPMVLIQKAA